jgi:hypothetical protein
MLKKLIVALYSLQTKQAADSNIVAEIDRILTENNLEKEDTTPDWLVSLFAAIVERKIVLKTYFKYDAKKGDVANFIAELEDLIPAQWNDYGEAVEVFFDKIDLNVVISSEGNFYKVSTV